MWERVVVAHHPPITGPKPHQHPTSKVREQETHAIGERGVVRGVVAHHLRIPKVSQPCDKTTGRG
jgi:hypothetical protein